MKTVESHIFTDINIYSLSGRMAADMEALLSSKYEIVSTFSGAGTSSMGSQTFYGVIFYREETK